MKKTIFLLVLTLLLAGGAVAQKTSKQAVLSSEAQIGVDPTDDTNPKTGSAFFGKENAAASMDVMNNLLRGNSYVLISNDRSSPSSLNVSMDFTPVDGEPGAYIVTSGSWTLVVYENGKYVGTIYGNVSEGSVTDTIEEGSGDIARRTVKVTFQITGGMAGFENMQNSPDIIYSATTDYYDEKNTTATLLNLL